MRIAISTDGELVSPHFGRCPSFTIIDIDNGQITNKENIANPGHEPGFIPQFLHQENVSTIVCGGMGMRASELFNQLGIRTIIGVTGKISDIIEKIKKGELTSGESLCRPGAGKGYGFDKTECDHSHQN
jgi:predicted Fe-Mo cluster-binding NifX family protein